MGRPLVVAPGSLVTAVYALSIILGPYGISLVAILGLSAAFTRHFPPSSHGIIRGSILFILLGVAATLTQVMRNEPSPSNQYLLALSNLEATGYDSRSDGTSHLLVSHWQLSQATSWNPSSGANTLAKYQGDGFWRFQRYSASGGENTHISLRDSIPLNGDKPITVSFLYRHDGTSAELGFDFLTNAGSNRVEVTQVGSRQVAIGTAQFLPKDEDDVLLRAVNLSSFQGDWTYLDLALYRVESGDIADAYVLEEKAGSEWHDILWWIGTGLLYILAVLGHLHLSTTGRTFIVRGLTVGLVLMSSVTLLVHFFPAIHVSNLIGFEATRGFRFHWLSSHPNILGHQVVLTQVLLVLLARTTRERLLALIGLPALILTGSRTAFLALIPTILYALLPYFRFRHLSLAFQLLSVTMVSSVVLHLLHPTGFTAIDVRLEAWRAAIHAWLSAPLAGIGQNELAMYIHLHPSDFYFPQAVNHAHNQLLSVLSEGGIISLFALLILLFRTVNPLVRISARHASLSVVTLFILLWVATTFFTSEVLFLVTMVPMVACPSKSTDA